MVVGFLSGGIGGSGGGPGIGTMKGTNAAVSSLGATAILLSPNAGKKVKIWSIQLSYSTTAAYVAAAQHYPAVYRDTGSNEIITFVAASGAGHLSESIAFPFGYTLDADEDVVIRNADGTAGACDTVACLVYEEV